MTYDDALAAFRKAAASRKAADLAYDDAERLYLAAERLAADERFDRALDTFADAWRKAFTDARFMALGEPDAIDAATQAARQAATLAYGGRPLPATILQIWASAYCIKSPTQGVLT